MSDRIMRAKQLTLSGEDFDNASAGTTANISVYLRDKSGKILLADGLDVPVDTSSGYAKGCLFIDRNVVTGTTGLYENTGTSTSCVFNAIGAVTAGEITLATGSVLLGTADVGAALDGSGNAKILVGNGTTMTSVSLSQDLTITNAGVVTINSHAADVTVATDKKIYFRDTGLYVYSSANGQLDVIGDTTVKVTAPTTEIASSVGVVLSSASSDTALEISGTATNFGIDISAAQTAVGLGISGSCVDGILIAGANTGHHVNMTGLWGQGITGAAISIGDYSNPVAFGVSTDHVIGIVSHIGVDLGAGYNAIPILGKITTSGDAAAGAVGQCILGQGVVAHDLADMYGVRGSVTLSGAPEVNQMFGLYATMTTSVCNMDTTGNIAGVGVLVSGTSDITQSGTYAKVSGLYIAWKETSIATVDTCGVYVGNFAGMALDSGVRVNHAGTTGIAFHSYLSGGAVTTGLSVEGAHTNAFAFPAEGTAPVSDTTNVVHGTDPVKISVLVGGAQYYMLAAKDFS